MLEGNRIAFRAEQHDFFVPDDEYVNMNVMNLYTLVDDKVKNGDYDLVKLSIQLRFKEYIMSTLYF